MNVKEVFNHISKNRLVERMMDMEIDRDLIKWTRLFLTDQKIQLVIDGHNNKE